MTRKLFFTSDTHYSHENIIKYSNRPFANADEMNEAMIANWNKTVSKSDIVWHLGDVAFEKDRNKLIGILERLNGEKHLIWGNHERALKSVPWSRYFHTANDMRVLNVPPDQNDGKAQRIVLCHYAMRVWDQSHYGTWQLYGHSHGTLPDDPNLLACDVGVDCWDYTPVSMAQLNDLMSKKTFKPFIPRDFGDRLKIPT